MMSTDERKYCDNISSQIQEIRAAINSAKEKGGQQAAKELLNIRQQLDGLIKEAHSSELYLEVC